MKITHLHCDATDKRVTTEACYEAYLAATCNARLTQYQRRALAPCVNCARGRRNRRRWYDEGLRFRACDDAGWRAQLAAWARERPELFPDGAGGEAK